MKHPDDSNIVGVLGRLRHMKTQTGPGKERGWGDERGMKGNHGWKGTREGYAQCIGKIHVWV